MSDDNPERRPPRPYLRKGQGTARFNQKITPYVPRPRSSAVSAQPTEGQSVSIVQNTQSTQDNEADAYAALPQSARTVDSGIAHELVSPYIDYEDDTRPPTLTSIIDYSHEPSPLSRGPTPKSRARADSAVPTISEVDEGLSEDQHEPEVLSPVPQAPSTSTPSEASDIPQQAKELRLKADAMFKQALANQEVDSLATSSGTESTGTMLSTPIGASTPINMFPLVHSKPPSFSIEDEGSAHFTPIMRPVPRDRKQQKESRNNMAQTGPSLISSQSSYANSYRPIVASQPNRLEDHIRQRQHLFKDPSLRQIRPPVTPAFRKTSPRRLDETQCPHCPQLQSKINNMAIQMRDTIAHLDFADERIRSEGEKFKEHFKLIIEATERQKQENERKLKDKVRDLEEDFKEKVESWEEERKLEVEKIARDRRQLEMDKKFLAKNEHEKIKTLEAEIERLRELTKKNSTTVSTMRNRERDQKAKMEKLESDLEASRKECERHKKNNATIEKELNILRKEKKEATKQANAAMINTVPLRMHNYRSNDATEASRPNRTQFQRSDRDLVQQREKSAERPRPKSVSFAPDQAYAPMTYVPDEIMHWSRSEVKNGVWGPYIVYSCAGKWVKATQTIGNGRLFEYDNGDQRWIDRNRNVQVYNFIKNGMTRIDLFPAKIFILFAKDGGVEIWREGGRQNEVSLLSSQGDVVRTEMRGYNGTNYFVEEFDRKLTLTRTDGFDTVRFAYRPNQKSTLRDGGSRYVITYDVDDVEYVEPEFRMRWVESGAYATAKFVRMSELPIRFETSPQGRKLELVDVKNGKTMKHLCFSWS